MIIFSAKKLVMKQLLFLLLLLSPFFIIAQDSSTEQLMAKLGYQKVDLDALKKEQLSKDKGCSTCPFKGTKKSTSAINHQHEIQKLKNQLPKLERILADAKTNLNMSPAMLQKHQTAIDNTKDRIKVLEKELSLINHPKK